MTMGVLDIKTMNFDEILLSEFKLQNHSEKENNLTEEPYPDNLNPIQSDLDFKKILNSQKYSVTEILKSIRFNNLKVNNDNKDLIPISSYKHYYKHEFIFHELYKEICVIPNVSGKEYLEKQKQNPKTCHDNVPASCDMFIALENHVIFCHAIVVLTFSDESIRRFCEDTKEKTDYNYLPLNFEQAGYGFEETMKLLEFMYTGKIMVEIENFEKFEGLFKAVIEVEINNYHYDPIDEDENSIISR